MNRRQRREERKRARHDASAVTAEAAAAMGEAERELAAGNLTSARRAAERAAKAAPLRPEPERLLGTIAFRAEDDAAAIRHLKRATAIAPAWPEAQYELAGLLLERERPVEAEAALRAALAARPDFVEAHASLGTALRQQRRLDEAEAALGEALKLKPDHAGALANRAAIRLMRGDAPGALAAADASLKIAQRSAAVLYRAMALESANDPAAATLIDFERFLMTAKISVPESSGGLAAFNSALAREVKADPTLKPSPKGRTTIGGAQSANLFRRPEGALAALRRHIGAAVERYGAALGDDPAHPFVAARPGNVSIYGWSTVLGRQGHQASHIHPAAWLSGVYYVKLPPELGLGGEDIAGWIEFGRPNPIYPIPAEPRTRLVRPEEGMLVLFPSYFWHRTIPFDSAEERISIAFDAIGA